MKRWQNLKIAPGKLLKDMKLELQFLQQDGNAENLVLFMDERYGKVKIL